MPEYQERLCALEGCGATFTPRRGNQTYHDPACAKTAANRRQRVGDGGPVEVSVEEHRTETRLRNEVTQLKGLVRELEDSLEKAERVAGVRGGGVDRLPPRWLTKPKRSAGHHATVMTILSDTHLDEVVRATETDHINAYDRGIAEMRLQRYFQRVPAIAHDYFQGASYDGAVCMLGGDLLSGNIHDELVQTNDGLSLLESITYWVPRLAAGLTSLADEFGQLHVPVVVGNHPRLTKRPRAKLRAVDNADWLVGRMVSDLLSQDERITFDVPEGTDAFVKAYDTGFLLTHGDQTTGGGGIGGIWPPVMRMRARKLTRYQASGRAFDHLVMGHYHQLIMAQGLIVNGSVVGYNEYAAVNNFAPEPAQQAMWLVTPERGITLQAPVFCEDREAEGWGRTEGRRRTRAR